LLGLWPEALAQQNNFHSLPADTVLAKMRNKKSGRKVVNTYGLYYDPAIARLLLATHHRLPLPPLDERHLQALRKLNWAARKGPLMASFQGYRHTATCADADAEADAEADADVEAEECVSRNNLLARLRDVGLVELVRAVLAFL